MIDPRVCRHIHEVHEVHRNRQIFRSSVVRRLRGWGQPAGGSPGVGAGCWADRAAQIVPLWAWRTWGLSAAQGGPGTGKVLRGVSEWYELWACGKLPCFESDRLLALLAWRY